MKLIIKLIDFFRKRNILKAAHNAGCDVDGDIVVYKGMAYVVHIQMNYIYRIGREVKIDGKQRSENSRF